MKCFVRGSAMVVIAFLAAACGGGGSSDPIPPIVVTPPPPPIVTPTASFTAAATATVNTPVAFDASASTSSDGSALQYSWDFGGGKRGGGKTIAHLFASAGSGNVTLTVIDGSGRTATLTKSIVVTGPITAPAIVSAQGVVKTIDGVALEGVTITQVGSASVATTDAMGKANLAVNAGVPITLKLSKSGYADQFLSINVPTTAAADAFFAASMRTRDAALTLPDAVAGGSLTGRDGAVITLPPNSLVNAAGAAVTGAVQIAMTPVDVTQPEAGGFPGSFDGAKQDGTITPIVSFGTTEYVLSVADQRLQLAPGKTATIEVPLYGVKRIDGTVLAPGDTTPLWSLDEVTGTWVQEGEGTVVDSTASPSGLAMRATVAHFTWWNSDIGFDPYGPRPKCVYDTNITGIPGANNTFATATICNMIASIDRGLAGDKSGNDRLSASAVTLPPRVAGYSRNAVLPIAGGVTIPVPANINIALDATALNGTWTGHVVVNGAVGVQAEALVPMRPLQATGPGPEIVTTPFDATRSLQTGQTALYNFAGSALKFARVTVTRTAGSSLIGSVRLLQGATVLGNSTFGGAEGPLIVSLPADATYTVEIAGTANTPGGYRVQIEQVGGVQDESIALPFDAGQKSLAEFTTYRGTFNVPAPMTIYVATTWLNARATFNIVDPNGAVIYTASSLSSAVQTATINLATAGNYILKANGVNGQETVFKATIEQTSWATVAPTIDLPLTGEGSGSLVDMAVDRNGKAVVLYTRRFASGIGSSAHTSVSYALQRWTGSAWENIASEVVSDYACAGGAGLASVAFDSANNPVLAYGSATVTNGSFTTVQRYSAGIWQPIGSSNGVLPHTSASSQSCIDAPIVQIGTGDLPSLAYRGDNTIYVQRLNGTAWVDVATSGSLTSFDAGTNPFDFKIDLNDRLWFVLVKVPPQSVEGTVVRRLSQTADPAWETVGSNGGRLPETNTQGLFAPHLRFDSAGNPVIAAGASVIVGPNTWTGGTIVYRYSGTTWSSTGGYLISGAGSDSVSGDVGFALFGNEAFVGWRTNGGSQLVQRNTSSAWTAVGAGSGRIPQLTPHGITFDTSGFNMRLNPIGSDLYIAIQGGLPSGATTSTPNRIHLLRKLEN